MPYVEGFERLRTKLGDFFNSRLVVDFDFKPQIFDHAPDFWCRLTWCGEVAVYEDGVGWIEGQWLETAEVMLAASGHAEFGARVEKSEEAEHF